MLDIPPEVRASWPAPNYTNPETRGPGLVVLIITFQALSVITVALRAFTRLHYTRSFGPDDAIILIAVIPVTGVAVCVLTANVRFGWDRHIWDLAPEQFKPGIALGFAATVLFAIASTFCKLSLLAFYHRLLSAQEARLFKWAIWTVGGLSAACTVVFIFQLSFTCRPAKAYFDFTPPLYHPAYPYTCHNRAEVKIYGSIGNALLDLATVLLPMPLAWRLRLPLRQRLAVIAIFALGMVVVVISGWKTKYIVQAIGESYDEQWDAYPLWMLSMVELHASLICASAPALRPLVIRFSGMVRMSMSMRMRMGGEEVEFVMLRPKGGSDMDVPDSV